MDISKIGMDERKVRGALTEIKAYLTGIDKNGLWRLIYGYAIPKWTKREQEEVRKSVYKICPRANPEYSDETFLRLLIGGNEECMKTLDEEAREVLDNVVEICYETRKRLEKEAV